MLACLSNADLVDLLNTGSSVHSGIGGRSLCITIEDSPVFVKRVPLTEFELKSENLFSTANLFGMPLSCSYGVGSPGFSAWRELAAHVIVTNWVISQACHSFPLLYHWRVLPNSTPAPLNLDEWGSLDNFVGMWGSSAGVRKRVEEMNCASSEILLFLEYIPQTLLSWLTKQINASEEAGQEALRFADESLQTITSFMSSQGFVHFDAHFKNILTDGKLVYLSDFGLAVCSRFDLSGYEFEFLKAHKNSYDRCTTAVSLVHAAITGQNENTDWKQMLRSYLEGDLAAVPVAFSSVIDRYGKLTMAMIEFVQELRQAHDAAVYPAAKLELLLTEADLAGS